MNKTAYKISKRSIEEYDTYIVDMDGTLYFQPNVRCKMIFKMLIHIFKYPMKIRDIYMIYLYRKIREKGNLAKLNDFTNKEYCYVALKTHASLKYVKKTIKYWMMEVPLAFIAKYKDEKLIDFLLARWKNGANIFIYSDYPVKDKLLYLNMKYSRGYYSKDRNIQCMKPETKGLNNIVRENNLSVKNCLFIGDRYEKDGCCAQGCNMDYLILPRYKRSRNKLWKVLM